MGGLLHTFRVHLPVAYPNEEIKHKTSFNIMIQYLFVNYLQNHFHLLDHNLCYFS